MLFIMPEEYDEMLMILTHYDSQYDKPESYHAFKNYQPTEFYDLPLIGKSLTVTLISMWMNGFVENVSMSILTS